MEDFRLRMSFKQKIQQFAKKQGRRPRVLVSHIGLKNHDHDTKLLAIFFAESGFDVDISPPNQTPRGPARMAIENDVHLICFLSTANRHKKIATEMAKALKAEEAENIKIVIGGAIPRSDYGLLYGAGVDLILSSVPADQAAINRLLELIELIANGS